MLAYEIFYSDRFNKDQVIIVCGEDLKQAKDAAAQAIHGNIYGARLFGKVS